MGQVIRTERLAGDAAGIDRAAELLRDGALVAFPTETVYGLGADARSDAAVAGIYAAKGRPSYNPLIVHVDSMETARRFGYLDATARLLAEAFWPGPLTLVLPLRQDAGLSGLVTAGLPSVAIRVPAHPVAQALLKRSGLPLAAPSANPSGRVSPTTAAHVLAGLDGRIAAVIDAGDCEIGLESTIVGTGDTPRLLRPGGLSSEAIEATLGQPLRGTPSTGAAPSSPGQLASHYAPQAALRLNATERRAGELLLGFGAVTGDESLSETGDLTEAAARLFAMLRALDGRGTARIAVAPIPDRGLGRAINDRLARAAAPRD